MAKEKLLETLAEEQKSLLLEVRQYWITDNYF
jgi:hypothetical protein